MTIRDMALRLASVLISIFGLIMIAGTLINIFDKRGGNSLASNISFILLLGIVPLVFGVWLFRRTQTGASRRAIEARERIVLDLASHHSGVLTVPQVAEQSGMTLEEAEKILDRLNLKGFNEMAVSESGAMVYTFRL